MSSWQHSWHLLQFRTTHFQLSCSHALMPQRTVNYLLSYVLIKYVNLYKIAYMNALIFTIICVLVWLPVMLEAMVWSAADFRNFFHTHNRHLKAQRFPQLLDRVAVEFAQAVLHFLWLVSQAFFKHFSRNRLGNAPGSCHTLVLTLLIVILLLLLLSCALHNLCKIIFIKKLLNLFRAPPDQNNTRQSFGLCEAIE